MHFKIANTSLRATILVRRILNGMGHATNIYNCEKLAYNTYHHDLTLTNWLIYNHLDDRDIEKISAIKEVTLSPFVTRLTRNMMTSPTTN
jgi:hypothetical protein